VRKPVLSVADKRDRTEVTVDIVGIFTGVVGLGQKITLFDDGRHGDGKANDGTYANTYADTTMDGPYLVRIDFEGSTSQGKMFKRTLQGSFQVGPIVKNSLTISELLGRGEKGFGRKRTTQSDTQRIQESKKAVSTRSPLDFLFKK